MAKANAGSQQSKTISGFEELRKRNFIHYFHAGTNEPVYESSERKMVIPANDLNPLIESLDDYVRTIDCFLTNPKARGNVSKKFFGNRKVDAQGRSSKFFQIDQKYFDSDVGHNFDGSPRSVEGAVWFRGDKGINFPVEPTLFRKKYYGNKEDQNGKKKSLSELNLEPQHNNYVHNERDMFTEMRSLLKNNESFWYSNFDTMAYARHYSLPVRLLDWSNNPLIALYFAVCDYDGITSICDLPKDDDGNLIMPCVTLLNPIKLNSKTSVVYSEKQSHILHAGDLDVQIRTYMYNHIHWRSLYNTLKKNMRTDDRLQCDFDTEIAHLALGLLIDKEGILRNNKKLEDYQVAEISKKINHILKIGNDKEYDANQCAELQEAYNILSIKKKAFQDYNLNQSKAIIKIDDIIGNFKDEGEIVEQIGKGKNSSYKFSKIIREALFRRMRMPVAVQPKRFDERLVGQAGNFTVHGGKAIINHKAYGVYSDDNVIWWPIDLEDVNSIDDPFMLRILINPLKAPEIARSLKLFGIDHLKAFPDSDNQARYLKTKYGLDQFLEHATLEEQFKAKYNKEYSDETVVLNMQDQHNVNNYLSKVKAS